MTYHGFRVRDYAIIFFAGVLWDSILSVDTILTANFSAWGAAFSTLTVTLLSYFMYDRIMENAKINWSKAATLAVGSAIGAGLTTGLLDKLMK